MKWTDVSSSISDCLFLEGHLWKNLLWDSRSWTYIPHSEEEVNGYCLYYRVPWRPPCIAPISTAIWDGSSGLQASSGRLEPVKGYTHIHGKKSASFRFFLLLCAIALKKKKKSGWSIKTRKEIKRRKCHWLGFNSRHCASMALCLLLFNWCLLLHLVWRLWITSFIAFLYFCRLLPWLFPCVLPCSGGAYPIGPTKVNTKTVCGITNMFPKRHTWSDLHLQTTCQWVDLGVQNEAYKTHTITWQCKCLCVIWVLGYVQRLCT